MPAPKLPTDDEKEYYYYPKYTEPAPPPYKPAPYKPPTYQPPPPVFAKNPFEEYYRNNPYNINFYPAANAQRLPDYPVMYDPWLTDTRQGSLFMKQNYVPDLPIQPGNTISDLYARKYWTGENYWVDPGMGAQGYWATAEANEKNKEKYSKEFYNWIQDSSNIPTNIYISNPEGYYRQTGIPDRVLLGSGIGSKGRYAYNLDPNFWNFTLADTGMPIDPYSKTFLGNRKELLHGNELDMNYWVRHYADTGGGNPPQVPEEEPEEVPEVPGEGEYYPPDYGYSSSGGGGGGYYGNQYREALRHYNNLVKWVI